MDIRNVSKIEGFLIACVGFIDIHLSHSTISRPPAREQAKASPIIEFKMN
jgi:hypothetical protein